MTVYKTIRIKDDSFQYLKNMNNGSIAGNLTLLIESITNADNPCQIIGETLGERFKVMRDHFGQIHIDKIGEVIATNELERLKRSIEHKRKRIAELEAIVKKLERENAKIIPEKPYFPDIPKEHEMPYQYTQWATKRREQGLNDHYYVWLYEG